MVTGNNTAAYPTYIDASLTPSDIDELSKFVLIHDTYHQIALFDTKTNSFCGLKTKLHSNPYESNQLVNDRWLRSRKKTKAILSSAHCSIIPNVVFDSKKTKDMLSLDHNLPKDVMTLSMNIRGMDATLIFGIPGSLFNDLNHQDIKLKHAFPNYFKTIQRDLKAVDSQVILNYLDTQLEVTVLKSDRLQLHNYYPCKTHEDFLYFAMLVFENMNLNPEITPTRVTGRIQSDDDHFKSLQKYIRDVALMPFPNQAHLAPELLEAPSHFYYQLMSAAL